MTEQTATDPTLPNSQFAAGVAHTRRAIEELLDADDLTQVRGDLLGIKILDMLDTLPATVSHDWYHDGVPAQVDGRLCRTCRLRERRDRIADEPCIGTAKPYQAGVADGEIAGAAAARRDVAHRLGLG